MARSYSRLEIITCASRFVLHMNDGRKIFVKANSSNHRMHKTRIRKDMDRERTCLEVLDGLAVPKLVRLTQAQLPRIISGGRTFFIAEEVAGDKPVYSMGLDIKERIAVWAFVAEQLAAFRRRFIVYSDIKCDNIMVRKNPLRIKIIDFDYIVPLVAGRKVLDRVRLGITPGFDPPEIATRKPLTEASLTYQLGMLMVSLMVRGNNRTLNDAKVGLVPVLKKVTHLGGGDMAGIVADCLKPEPRLRPQNYEHVLRRLKAARIPAGVRDIWDRLRAPYAQSLENLGL